eukprot:CAMPEP_0176413734 /NCGR_PEP_ID=MMETSP0127-20121128/4865_1 /TAXON_ID=938130 /ORGANISM="Platyophrya macrostoma, Strain WH" /LENGTH=320 /DNA_ID=CAMNT_0017793551 /DNA_START=45 /DNA_END=1008 /DNA_ORIENTATION=+
MSTPMVAMDPEKKDDTFYRYKMPAFEKFELGTQRIVSNVDDKFIVMGSRTQEEMQEKVYAFIKKFVLCRHCRNPETHVSVQKDVVSMRCGACGKSTVVSPAERCTPLLASYYKTAKPAPKATPKPAEEQASVASVAKKENVELVPVIVEQENPALTLAKYLKTESSLEAHIRRVNELRSEHNLSDKVLVKLVFYAIIETNATQYMAALTQHRKLLARFVLVKELAENQSMEESAAAEAKKREKTLQSQLISQCESHVCLNRKPWQLPIMLLMLFEQGVLKQQSIEEWAPAKPKKGEAASPDAEVLKQKMEPLLAWLKASD